MSGFVVGMAIHLAKPGARAGGYEYPVLRQDSQDVAARVMIRRYSREHSSDPRTHIRAVVGGITVEKVFRPPLAYEEARNQIIPFAEAAIAASDIINNDMPPKLAQ